MQDILQQHEDMRIALCLQVLTEDYKRILLNGEPLDDEKEKRIVAFHNMFEYYCTFEELEALDKWRWQQIEIVVDKIPKVA